MHECKKKIGHRVGAGLESWSVLNLAPAEQTRIQSNEDIALFVSLFGESSFCGVCRKKPKVSDGTRILQQNETVSLLLGGKERASQSGRWSISNSTGIDLKFCPEDNSFSIVVRYKRLIHEGMGGYEASESGSKRFKRLLMREDPASVVEDDTDGNSTEKILDETPASGGVIVEKNVQFAYKDEVYSVVSTDSNGYTIIRNQLENKTEKLTTTQVEELILAYL